MRRIALAVALLLVAAAVAGVARPEGAHAVDGTAPSTDSVTVSGNGSVTAVPTTAVLGLGVDTRAASARAALSANAREMRNVIDAVKGAGGRNVGTQVVSLSQVSGPNGEITGYAKASAADVSTPIEAGTQETVASVTVTFALA